MSMRQVLLVAAAALVAVAVAKPLDVTKCSVATFTAAKAPSGSEIKPSLSTQLMIAQNEITIERALGNGLVLCFGGAKAVNATNQLRDYTSMELSMLFDMERVEPAASTEALNSWAATTMAATTTAASTATTTGAAGTTTTAAPPTPAGSSDCDTVWAKAVIADLAAEACLPTNTGSAQLCSTDATATATADGVTYPVYASGAGCKQLAEFAKSKSLETCPAASGVQIPEVITACSDDSAASSVATAAAAAVAVAAVFAL